MLRKTPGGLNMRSSGLAIYYHDFRKYICSASTGRGSTGRDRFEE